MLPEQHLGDNFEGEQSLGRADWMGNRQPDPSRKFSGD